MNSYNADKESVQVVIMGANCEFTLKLIDRVKVTAKLDMSFDEFFSTGQTSFVDNTAAVLGINPSRIKITRIIKGSVNVQFSILAIIPVTPLTPEEDPDQKPVYSDPNEANPYENADEELKEAEQKIEEEDTEAFKDLQNMATTIEEKAEDGSLGEALGTTVVGGVSTEVTAVATPM